MGFEPAAGDEEIGDALDGAARQGAGDDGAADIDKHYGVIDPAKMHIDSCVSGV